MMNDPGKPAPPPPPPPPPQPAPPIQYGPGEYNPNPEERSTAMWAHLGTALVNWFGAWGIIVAIVMYFVKKDQSKFVAFHALQEIYLQIFVFVSTVVCVLTGLVCCFPFFFIPVIVLGSTVYSVIVALKANDGYWEEFWLIGGPAKRSVLGAQLPPAPPGTPMMK